MKDKQWVQHISGHGNKWEVGSFNEDQWGVIINHEACGYHWLPKSEFIPCSSPEVWRDVTEECSVESYLNSSGEFWSIVHNVHRNVMSKINTEYRIRKVKIPEGSAFIIEKKVSE